MKFWNKHPEVRKRHWTKVDLRPDTGPTNNCETMTYQGWMRWGEFNRLKSELQHNASTGKFYMDIMLKRVWFETEADATWFMLTRRDT
jgi:hypothetical protein